MCVHECVCVCERERERGKLYVCVFVWNLYACLKIIIIIIIKPKPNKIFFEHGGTPSYCRKFFGPQITAMWSGFP